MLDSGQNPNKTAPNANGNRPAKFGARPAYSGSKFGAASDSSAAPGSGFAKKINFVPASAGFSSVRQAGGANKSFYNNASQPPRQTNNSAPMPPPSTNPSMIQYPIMQYYQGNQQAMQPKPTGKQQAQGDAGFGKRKFDSFGNDSSGSNKQARTDQQPSQAPVGGFNVSNYGYGYSYGFSHQQSMPQQQSMPSFPSYQMSRSQPPMPPPQAPQFFNTGFGGSYQ